MSEFSLNNKSVFNELEKRYTQIIENAKLRHGKKSFHILMMLYFQDMYDVLKEMRRILTPNAHAYLILGDSAPYGIHIPTTQFLGEIAQSVGFGDFRIYKIRSRGDKWKGLSNRHNIELSENILELS
jgi:DNA modification methylase